MKIQNIISQLEEINDDVVVYAARVNGQFHETSDAILLELTEDETDLPTKEIARLKCPGFDYFLEVFIIKELVEGLVSITPFINLARKTEAVIHYAEFDA